MTVDINLARILCDKSWPVSDKIKERKDFESLAGNRYGSIRNETSAQ